MGRAKIDIKLIKNHKNKYTTYNKRIFGLLKKVEEISVLCDVHACVFSYGPPSVEKGGIPSFHVRCGKRSASVEQIIDRFLSLPKEEQEQEQHKKLDVLRFLDEEIPKLQKMLSNQKNTISDLTAASDFPLPSNLDRLSPQQLEDVSRHVQAKLYEVEERMSTWRPSIQPQQQEEWQQCQLLKSTNSAPHFPQQELGVEGCMPNSSVFSVSAYSLPQQQNHFLNHGTIPVQEQRQEGGHVEQDDAPVAFEQQLKQSEEGVVDGNSVSGFQDALEWLCGLTDEEDLDFPDLGRLWDWDS